MDNASAFRGVDVVPGNDTMLDTSLNRKFIKWPTVPTANQVRATNLFFDGRLASQRRPRGILRHVELLSIDAGQHVVQIGVDGGGDVRRQRPRGRRPNQETRIWFVEEGQSDVDRIVGPLLIPLSYDLVLGNASSTTWAPGHDVVPLVEPAPVMNRLEEMPDGVVVLLGHCEVGVIPVHPVTESDGLVGDAIGE